MEIGEQATFFSEDKKKNIKGKIVKINNKTVILEVQKEKTIIEIIKSSLAKFSFLSKPKEKKIKVTEVKHIKKRFNQLVA